MSPTTPYGALIDSLVRVVTWNLWWRLGDWESRLEGIAQTLEDHDPDQSEHGPAVASEFTVGLRLRPLAIGSARRRRPSGACRSGGRRGQARRRPVRPLCRPG